MKTFLTWTDVDNLVTELVERVGITASTAIYGVPRGGAIVAKLIQDQTQCLLTDAIEANFVVDDLIDSGRTADRFPGQAFRALFDKRDPKCRYHGRWVVFPWEDPNEHIKDGEECVARILELLGEDPTRDGLQDTPSRVVKSWSELFGGYAMDPAVILERRFPVEGAANMVVCRDIDFSSTCEHHMLPFNGKAHVAYIPKVASQGGVVVGLSKLARLVDCFARRLQIQERLTNQVADALAKHVPNQGVAVLVEAQHHCMMCRGVGKPHSVMATPALQGAFFDSASARAEFYALLGRPGM